MNGITAARRYGTYSSLSSWRWRPFGIPTEQREIPMAIAPTSQGPHNQPVL